MSITRVQSEKAIGRPGTLAAAFDSNNTAGNVIVVVAIFGGESTTPSISDTNHNNYSILRGTDLDGNGDVGMTAWVANNIVAGANTVSVVGTGFTDGVIFIVEYNSSAGSFATIDGSVYAHGAASTTLDPGSITTAQANEVVIGYGGQYNVQTTFTQGTGFSLFEQDSNGNDINGYIEDKIVTSTGTYDAQATQANSTAWSAAAVSLFFAPPPTHSISGNAGIVYTTLAVETGANASNPMDPANWTYVTNLPAVYGVLLATGTEIESTITSALESAGVYTGVTFPNDQWAEFQVDNVLPDGNTTALLAIRVTPEVSAQPSAYVLEIDGPLGASCSVSFYSLVLGVVTTNNFQGPTTVNAGSVIRLEAHGTTITALIDGVIIGQMTSNTDSTSGWPRVVLFPESASSDVQVSNFKAGSLAVVSPVTITWTGPSSGSTTTDANGDYTIPSLANGAYVITPSFANYSFAPASQTKTLSGANITNVNFAAIPNASISGNAGKPLASVSLVGLNTSVVANTTADGGGAYSFSNLPADTFSVAVRFTGFVPSGPQSVVLDGVNVTGVNFSFSGAPTYTYTQLAADSFSRANENPLNPAHWTVDTGAVALQVISDVCESTSLVGSDQGWEFYSGIVWPNNQYAQITVAECLNSNASISIAARDDGGGDTGNNYNFSIVGPINTVVDVEFIKNVAGVITTVADIPTVINTNDVIRIEVIGTTVYFKVNSDIIYKVTDASLAAGSPSIFEFISDGSSLSHAQVTNFSGGRINGSTGPTGGSTIPSFGTESPTGSESSGSTQISSRQTSVVGTNAGTQIIG